MSSTILLFRFSSEHTFFLDWISAVSLRFSIPFCDSLCSLYFFFLNERNNGIIVGSIKEESLIYFIFVCIVLIAELGFQLEAELQKRIMVIDGAMGTMIQKRELVEEDYR